jgi:hypothetical protein
MFTNSTTLKIGVSHARADLPAVVELIAKGSFEPLKVATLIADWDDAPEAFTTRTTKVIVRRPNFRRFDSNATQQPGQVEAAQSGLSGR